MPDTTRLDDLVFVTAAAATSATMAKSAFMAYFAGRRIMFL